MQIEQQLREKHSIEAYSTNAVRIQKIEYQTSLILAEDRLITDWPVAKLEQLDQQALQTVLALKPELLLLGHQAKTLQLPIEAQLKLAEAKIAFEVMNLGAACRSYNLLLGEGRRVVLGLIFDTAV